MDTKAIFSAIGKVLSDTLKPIKKRLDLLESVKPEKVILVKRVIQAHQEKMVQMALMQK